jgi:hypothetical protein
MRQRIRGVKSFSEFDYFSFYERQWRSKASCRTADTSLFFSSPKSQGVVEAKKICSSCSVSGNCLFSALQYQYFGVWGNTTDEERNYITRKIYKNDISKLTLNQCEKMVKMF